MSELKIITQQTCLHFISLFSLNRGNINKPQHQRTNMKVRKTAKQTKEAMMGNFHPTIIESGASLREAYNQFSKEMLDMLDRVAPEKNIKTTNRPKHSWYSTFIRNQHKIVRNREKISRRYRQDHQWKVYKI